MADALRINKMNYQEYVSNNLRKLNTLNSGDLSWIKSKKFRPQDLVPYTYPSENEFKKNKIQIIYLGWFFKDWSMLNNAKSSITEGLKIRDKKFILKINFCLEN